MYVSRSTIKGLSNLNSISLLICIFFLLCFASLTIGVKPLHLSEFTKLSSDTWLTLLASRIPRLMTLIIAGVGLSVCGVILQQIVRNKFVEPATTGGLDAAKLGILVALIHLSAWGTTGKMIGALVFCLASSLLFISILRLIRFKNAVLVPVIGLMYSAVLNSVAEFYAYQNNLLQNMQGWLLGDFSKVIQGSYEIIYVVLPIIIATYIFAHRFTVVGMGESVATSLGLNYFSMTILGLILVATTVSSVVITVGAIPFIGLVIPNLVSVLFGDNLKKTLPIIALTGATVLLVCDVFGRIILYPFEVPIGLTVSCLGGCVFLFIIWKCNR